MKTWKNLYPRICSFENLLLASRKAERGKRFVKETFEFNSRIEENLLELERELLSHKWEPGPYRHFYVNEAKRRLISAAPYRDRVVHHALCNIIEPIFDRTFIYDSYACRTGKGTHKATDRYTEFSRKARYVLKCDISRYFDSIRHDILFERLSRRIRDNETLGLLGKVIRSYGDDGLLWPSGRGIPIGNLTSQFFANLYLDGFDHCMKEITGCRFYIRYVDDFVVLSDSRKWLHSLVPRIEEQLSEIGLELHPRKRNVFPVSEGCDFMGYRIWPEHRRIRPKNGYRFQRRLKAKARDFRLGKIDFDDLNSSIMSWIGHASHADSWGLRKSIFAKVSFLKGQGKSAYRVLRGGSWNNNANNCRSANRNNNNPDNRNNNNGFRACRLCVPSLHSTGTRSLPRADAGTAASILMDAGPRGFQWRLSALFLRPRGKAARARTNIKTGRSGLVALSKTRPAHIRRLLFIHHVTMKIRRTSGLNPRTS